MPRKKVEYYDDDYYDEYDDDDYYEEDYDTYMSPNSGIFIILQLYSRTYLSKRSRTTWFSRFYIRWSYKYFCFFNIEYLAETPAPPDTIEQTIPNIPYPKDNIPKKEIQKKTPVKKTKKTFKSDKLLSILFLLYK